jgi:hypothetical protein
VTDWFIDLSGSSTFDSSRSKGMQSLVILVIWTILARGKR